jgi:hypothetical protein
MRLIISVIALLSITLPLFPMHISMMPDDVVLLIIGKPGVAALEQIITIQINSNQGYRSTKQIISHKQARNALIPCFNFLMTNKRYYSDTFKNKVGTISLKALCSFYFQNRCKSRYLKKFLMKLKLVN